MVAFIDAHLEVELPTLEWMAWFNTERLLEPLGNLHPPNKKSSITASQRLASPTSHVTGSPEKPRRFIV
jgi:hypothetical protein